MLTLSHVHQLFSPEQCHAYIHALRWNDRSLQCPRCRAQMFVPGHLPLSARVETLLMPRLSAHLQ
jgi:hypothetical protein